MEIITQEINMKRKFKHKVISKLTKKEFDFEVDQWYARFNKAYYKQNTNYCR